MAAVVLVEAGIWLKVQDLWSEVLLFSCLYGEVLPSEKPAKTQNNPVKTTKNEELNGVIPGGNERTGESRFMKVNTIWDDRSVANQGVDKATFKNTAKQLVQVWTLSQSHQELYDYDATGNRDKLTVNGTVQTYQYYKNAAGGNLAWLAYDQKWFYSYDNNGNLVTKAKAASVNYTTRAFVTDTSQEYWTYSWDLKNRLSSVSKNGVLIVTYSYDADNLRVARIKGSETTVYAYGRNGALTYQKNLATGKARTYAYLGSEVVGWTDTAADGTQTKMWALTDQLGSVTKVTNASAKVVWSSEYNPFGKTAGVEGLYDFDGSYAGHQPDNDVGLIYMWNRWQDPETGRFISEDPARAGSNYYAYANHRPLNLTDPTGLDPDPDNLLDDSDTSSGGDFWSWLGNLFSGGGSDSSESDGKQAGPPAPSPPKVETPDYSSSFKVPDGFYNQFNASDMKDFWAEGLEDGTVGSTSCSTFLPFLAKKLGNEVYEDIFGEADGLSAQKLLGAFQSNPKLTELLPDADGVAGAQARGELAQSLADEGYLVVSSLETEKTGHVSAVGPSNLTFSSYPEDAWVGDKGTPRQGGTANGGTVLRDYPVFVQAGSYTGVIQPGYAQGRANLNKNLVHYFVYKP